MRRIVGCLLLAAAALAAQTPQELFQQGLVKERSEGKLQEAIQLYQKAAQSAGKDRALAAKALVQAGECYQKLGNAESRKLFERVVREFADQKAPVAAARAALSRAATSRRLTSTVAWSGKKVDDEGTVSPDGRYLSFTDWDTGDIGIHDFATGEDRRVTKFGNSDKAKWSSFAEESTISHDSKQIAFSVWVNGKNRYELRVANANGDSNPRLVFDDPDSDWLAPRDWSPDGKFIALTISRRKADDDRIALVSVADGSLRVLRSGHFAGDTRIFFSPDGRYIGYDLPESNVSQPRDLFVFDLAANREIPAAVRRGQDIMTGWSPDGKRLLFASDRGGSLGLWALPFADGKLQGPAELLKADLGSVETLGVSRAGTLYYGVTGGGGASRVRIGNIDLATGKLSAVHDVSDAYPEDNRLPFWSPDGKVVAYVSRRGSQNRPVRTVVIRYADGGQAVREIACSSWQNLQGWAPDGHSLLAIGWLADGSEYGALRVDLETGAVSSLATESNAANRPRIQAARWLPDGKTLILTRQYPNGGPAAFIRRDVVSAEEKELVRRPSLGAINLSPDGRFIATMFVDPLTNTCSLLLIPVDGSEPRDLMTVPSGLAPGDLRTAKGQRVGAPMWSPDSKWVLVRKSFGVTGLPDEQWLLYIDGRPPRKLETPIEANVWFYGFHPDGKRMLATIVDSSDQPIVKQIWTLENFLPAAK